MLFTTVYSLWINEQSVYPLDCIPSPLLRKQLPVFAVKYRTKYVIATYKNCGFATLKSSLQLLRGMCKSLGHDEEAGKCSVLALAASVRAQIAPGARTAMAAEHAPPSSRAYHDSKEVLRLHWQNIAPGNPFLACAHSADETNQSKVS